MKLHDIHLRDPYILVDNGTYHLYGTRPDDLRDKHQGFDVYTSINLEDWSAPIPVFEKPDSFWADRDFWAPEVHKYKGKYYMFASFYAPNRRRATHILVSDAPDHAFQPLTAEPVTPPEWECLDGTLYISKKGEPYIVFCHEWLQVSDGKIVAMKLTDDLRQPADKPRVLFNASSPAWATGDPNGNYITDGPYLYRNSDTELYMLWSTQCGAGDCCRYVEACAVSDNGEIDGNWQHCEHFIFDRDGGHGMLFHDLSNQLHFIMHAPNRDPLERPVIFHVQIKNGCLSIAD